MLTTVSASFINRLKVIYSLMSSMHCSTWCTAAVSETTFKSKWHFVSHQHNETTHYGCEWCLREKTAVCLTLIIGVHQCEQSFPLNLHYQQQYSASDRKGTTQHNAIQPRRSHSVRTNLFCNCSINQSWYTWQVRHWYVGNCYQKKSTLILNISSSM